MSVIKRINLGSIFKLALVVYAFVGLIVGAICAVFILAGSAVFSQLHMPFVGVTAAVLCLIAAPIFYGILGAVIWVMIAALYNLAAGWVGGVELELG
jgi:hypothetical protein